MVIQLCCHKCGIEIFVREYTSYPICNRCVKKQELQEES